MVGLASTPPHRIAERAFSLRLFFLWTSGCLKATKPQTATKGGCGRRKTAKFTIMLPDVVNLNLEIYAAQQGVPKSQVVEEALAAHVGQKGVLICELPQISWQRK